MASGRLPALLPHLATVPDFLPQCLCCTRAMPWELWLQRAWLCPGRRWASRCPACTQQDSAFAALVRAPKSGTPTGE